jgi:two-component system sensor histidine kinase CreC
LINLAPPEPDCDAFRLEQVLIGLLNNAIKLTPPGGIIRLQAETRGPAAVFETQGGGAAIPTRTPNGSSSATRSTRAPGWASRSRAG